MCRTRFPLGIRIVVAGLLLCVFSPAYSQSAGLVNNRGWFVQGDTVIWVNKDLFPHNATATDRSFQSSEIGPEGSWKFSADKKGEHAYACTLHPPMKAKLIVK